MRKICKEIIKRDSTLRHQYIKGILGKNTMTKKQQEEHYEQYNLDINICAYCGEKANTLDHIFGLVNDKVFSGYTNDISNLIPSCSSCNSSKGNKDWDKWIESTTIPRAIHARNNSGFEERIVKIKEYIKKNKTMDKKINYDILEKINKNALYFDKQMTIKLEELDEIFTKHQIFYKKMLDNKYIVDKRNR